MTYLLAFAVRALLHACLGGRVQADRWPRAVDGGRAAGAVARRGDLQNDPAAARAWLAVCWPAGVADPTVQAADTGRGSLVTVWHYATGVDELALIADALGVEVEGDATPDGFGHWYLRARRAFGSGLVEVWAYRNASSPGPCPDAGDGGDRAVPVSASQGASGGSGCSAASAPVPPDLATDIEEPEAGLVRAGLLGRLSHGDGRTAHGQRHDGREEVQA